MNSGSIRSTVGGFGAILLWSTSVAFARSLSEQLGPVTAATAVYGVSGAISLISLLRSNQNRQRILQLPLRYLVGCGALFAGYTLLLFLAVGSAGNHQQVVEVGLLNYLWPILTFLFSLVLLGKRANWIILPGTLLALVGLFLVVTQGAAPSWQSLCRNLAGNPVAYTSAFVAAVSWALYTNLTNRWVHDREQGGMPLFLPATALIMLLLSCTLEESRQWSFRALTEVLFLGIATYAAYMLWDNAARRGNIVPVIAASYLTPLLSTIVTCIYLDIMPGARLWIGCGALVLGSILSWQAISRVEGSDSEQPTVIRDVT
ncbi:MAG: aromatic amino acid DMT transporter YddG [bacterium]|nr:aromatic amino acid DMT transporter YddG [bacterium]